ncbi:MAG TPA: O-antigen ligase family protein [bacterium]|nr:O-antigen ligase family protein [bacterium]
MTTLAIFLFSFFLVGGVYTAALSNAIDIKVIFGLFFYSLPTVAVCIYMYSTRKPVTMGPFRSMKYVYALLLLLLMGVLYSTDMLYGFYKIYETVRNLLISVILVQNVSSPRLWKKLLKYCAVINIPIAFFIVGRYMQIGFFDFTMFGNPIGVSEYLALSNIAALCYYSGNKERRGSLFLLLVTTLPAILVQLICTSRGPLMAMFFCFGLWLFLFSKIGAFKKTLIVGCLAVALAAAAQSASFGTLNKFMKLSQAEGLEADTYDRSAGVRLLMNLDALNEFRDASHLHHLLGFGTGSFKALGFFTTDDEGELIAHEYPHNILIEALYENGAVGVVLLLWTYLYVFKTLRQVRKSPNPYRLYGVLISVFGCLVSMFSGNIADNHWIWLGVIMAQKALILPEETSEEPAPTGCRNPAVLGA